MGARASVIMPVQLRKQSTIAWVRKDLSMEHSLPKRLVAPSFAAVLTFEKERRILKSRPAPKKFLRRPRNQRLGKMTVFPTRLEGNERTQDVRDKMAMKRMMVSFGGESWVGGSEIKEPITNDA